jgi:hypothetical protein
MFLGDDMIHMERHLGHALRKLAVLTTPLRSVNDLPF